MCLQQKRHLQGKTFKQQYYLLHPNYEETTLRSKEAYVFNLWYQYNSFCLLFRFSMVHYCDLLVTNPVMVVLQIMFVKTFLALGLVWQFMFFPEITMCTFIFIGSSTKFWDGITIVLLSAKPTFYQIYRHFRVTVDVFLYLINFVWMFTFKSARIFHVTT